MPVEIKIVLACVFWICVIYLMLQSEDGRQLLAIGAVIGTVVFLFAVALQAPKPAAVTTRVEDAKAAYETYQMRRDMRKLIDAIDEIVVDSIDN